MDKNNYLVLLNGALDSYKGDRPGVEIVLGGADGSYVPERDNKIATAHAISFIVCMENYNPLGWNWIKPLVPSFPEQTQESDIYRILGRNLFKAR